MGDDNVGLLESRRLPDLEILDIGEYDVMVEGDSLTSAGVEKLLQQVWPKLWRIVLSITPS